MLRRVESHVFVHPVHVVLDDPLFLRHAKDLRYLVGPSEDPRIIWLPAALRVESGLVEDHEVRSPLDDRGVELTQIARIRLLSAALRHVEHARRHGPRNEGAPYRIRPFRVVTMRPQPINRPSSSAALWSRPSRSLAPPPSRWSSISDFSWRSWDSSRSCTSDSASFLWTSSSLDSSSWSWAASS